MKSQVVAVASGYRPLVAFLERAVQGTGITVSQVSPVAADLCRIATISPPAVIVLFTQKTDSSWLDAAEQLRQVAPAVKVIVCGESVDVGSVARAVVHGVCDYIPFIHYSDPHDARQAITRAIANENASSDSMYGRVKAMLPLPTQESGIFRTASGKLLMAPEAIQQCVRLGFTDAETIAHLGVQQAAVLAAARTSRGSSGAKIPLATLTKYAVALCACIAIVWAVPTLLRWMSIKTVAVSGEITYDKVPVDRGGILFVPVSQTKGKTVGAVIHKGQYAVSAEHGLERGGTYRVEITALRDSGEVRETPMGRGAAQEQFIPCAYNIASQLVVEVPSAARRLPASYALERPEGTP